MQKKPYESAFISAYLIRCSIPAINHFLPAFDSRDGSRRSMPIRANGSSRGVRCWGDQSES